MLSLLFPEVRIIECSSRKHLTLSFPGDQYYAVTKGIRVGVVGSWLRMSPYVTGVPKAASSMKRTLEAAYAEYCEAYQAGLCSYL